LVITLFEIDIIPFYTYPESTRGRESAKARGKTGGRPRTDPEKLEQAKILYENSDKTAQEVCKIFGFGRRTLFNYLSEKRKDFKSM